jgi:hypothetical protein
MMDESGRQSTLTTQCLAGVAAFCLGLAACSGSSATAPSADIQLTSTPNPSTVGASVTLTATLSAVGGSPTGTVSFKDNGLLLGLPVNVAEATSFTTTGLPTGTHSLTAVYNGDADFPATTSTPVSQVVNKGPTTTGLTVTQPGAGQPVTFVATVSAAAASGSPTGSVTFLSDGATISSATLVPSGDSVRSTASLTTQNVSTGSHGFNATYVGDANSLASTSSTVQVTIQ